jgi:hypothetical protein
MTTLSLQQKNLTGRCFLSDFAERPGRLSHTLSSLAAQIRASLIHGIIGFETDRV